MKVKPKKCKGTGKAINNGCGKLVLGRRYGLGFNCCFNDWLLNTKEGNEQLKKATLKATQPRRSLETTAKEIKNRKGITTHLLNTKDIVHKYIRQRDKGLNCISCLTPYQSNFQAGHCFSANNYRSIKFNLSNINGQCQKCNLFEYGNETAYLINLPNRIGLKAFNELKHLAAEDKRHNKKWTKDELKEIRNNVKELIKQLKT